MIDYRNDHSAEMQILNLTITIERLKAHLKDNPRDSRAKMQMDELIITREKLLTELSYVSLSRVYNVHLDMTELTRNPEKIANYPAKDYRQEPEIERY
jgi:ribosomal protein S15P/S13E